MKQSAVELFNQEIKELFNQHQDGEISGSIFHFQRLVALTKAKEMEKQQIVDACYYGHLKGWVDDGVENSYGEQYYNETFKK